MLEKDDFVDLSLAVVDFDFNFKPQPVKGVPNEFIKVDKESSKESSE